MSHHFLLLFLLCLSSTHSKTLKGWILPTAKERLFSPSTSCDFDVVQTLSKQLFQTKYQHKRPVLLRGYGNSFVDALTISSRKHLLQTFGSLLVDVGISSTIVQLHGHGDRQETLSAYLTKSRKQRARHKNNNGKEMDYAFFNFHLRPNTTQVYKDAMGVVDAFRSKLVQPLDHLFHENTKTATGPSTCSNYNNDKNHTCRPPPSKFSSYLLVGTSQSGVNFHSHGDGWNLLLAGMKSWQIYLPGSLEPGYESWKGHLHWLKSVLPQQKDLPYHCHQRAGDLLYIPEGHIHATLNLGETFALAIQMNEHTTVLGKLEATLSKQLKPATRKSATTNLINPAARTTLKKMIAYHERTHLRPSQPRRDFLSSLYLDLAKMSRLEEKYTNSIAEADVARELNDKNTEAHLVFALNAGTVDTWDVQMQRLQEVHQKNPSFVLGTVSLAAHFLEGCRNGEINKSTLFYKKQLYVKILLMLTKAIEFEEQRAAHLIYKQGALHMLASLSSILSRMGFMMKDYIVHRRAHIAGGSGEEL